MHRHHFENCKADEKEMALAEKNRQKLANKAEKSAQKQMLKDEQIQARYRRKEEKTKKKILAEQQRLAALKKPQFTCCYCGKTTDSANLKRWHGDNCKSK